ncbi:MAG TPA: hypothetical protein VMT91_15470 [Anaerolineales bacterium]|nr:hypothetical protein [Anaerolineales bacterium]
MGVLARRSPDNTPNFSSYPGNSWRAIKFLHMVVWSWCNRYNYLGKRMIGSTSNRGGFALFSLPLEAGLWVREPPHLSGASTEDLLMPEITITNYLPEGFENTFSDMKSLVEEFATILVFLKQKILLKKEMRR